MLSFAIFAPQGAELTNSSFVPRPSYFHKLFFGEDSPNRKNEKSPGQEPKLYGRICTDFHVPDYTRQLIRLR